MAFSKSSRPIRDWNFRSAWRSEDTWKAVITWKLDSRSILKQFQTQIPSTNSRSRAKIQGSFEISQYCLTCWSEKWVPEVRWGWSDNFRGHLGIPLGVPNAVRHDTRPETGERGDYRLWFWCKNDCLDRFVNTSWPPCRARLDLVQSRSTKLRQHPVLHRVNCLWRHHKADSDASDTFSNFALIRGNAETPRV